MSEAFAQDLLRQMPLTPTEKLLKTPSGHVIPSSGIMYVLPITVDNTPLNLSFYIYDINEFDLLIGQPLKQLIHEGKTGKLNYCLGKNFKGTISITHSLNAEDESCPEPDPVVEIKEASFEQFNEPDYEEDA